MPESGIRALALATFDRLARFVAGTKAPVVDRQAIAGCAKVINSDKLKPILVSEDRSGQLLQQKIRNSITDMDEHLFCGSKHYDKIYYLFLLTLHPQNKNRSIVLFPEQFNNIEENPDLEKEIDEDNAVEDADVYFPV